MIKKVICLSLLPLLLSGCNVDNISTTNIDNNYLIKEKTTIDFLTMVNGSYLDKLQEIVDSFKSVEPNVTVNIYNPLGSGKYNMLEQYVVSGFFKGVYPDIVQCYPDHVVTYLAKDYVINVDDYFSNSVYGLTKEEKDDYYASLLDEGRHYAKEGTYSLPFCKSTEVMFYNAEVLLGLDLSSVNDSINKGEPLDEAYLDNLTWEELFNKLAPAIKEYNETLDESNKIMDTKDTYSVVTYDSDENFFITLATQYGYGYTSVDENGKGIIDFNNDEMKALIKKFKGYKDSKLLLTTGSNNKKYVSNLFRAKKTLFSINSSAGLSYNYNSENPFKIGVAKIPYADGKEYMAINQGPSVCLLNHYDDNRSLASYLLWKHLTSKENASIWTCVTNYMGVRASAYESEEYKDIINVSDETDLYSLAKADIFKKIREVSDYSFNTAVFRGSSHARSNVGNLLINCLNASDVDDIDTLFDECYQNTIDYVK